ncbi:succinylglutamate desuccinylase [Oceanisphaera pacifica]|uniref:Succinylglutamate desuccinylase n=1 Tax=Oceanisphaera pacifica TaxID=2818389 RepID=A0ABS3NES8_9GAMM|nr:succinylglutamate desuccinylase [Oceanisphaera pacifica]MBO1519083.1 succinylglutamate desuccinylase [Oceanisphaera pacifica]
MNASRLNDFLALSCAHPHYLAPFNETLPDGTQIQVWNTGVVCIEPPAPANLDLVLSCGIHGNETAPIELCTRLLNDIVNGRLRCQQRLLLIFGNLSAINLNVREVKTNLNRLFSGAHGLKEHIKVQVQAGRAADGQDTESDRAAWLEHYVTRFYQKRKHHNIERRHYDLHTAIRASQYPQFAIYPFTHGAPYHTRELAFLCHSDVNTILLAHGPTTTFSYFSAHHFGAHAFTVELGKVHPFGENDASQVAALEHNLAQLLQKPDWQPPQLNVAHMRVFQVCQEVIKQSEQFCFHFSDDVANFSTFSPGTLLAEDGDWQWRVGEKPQAIVFPNAKVALQQRAALMVEVTELKGNMLV